MRGIELDAYEEQRIEEASERDELYLRLLEDHDDGAQIESIQEDEPDYISEADWEDQISSQETE